MDNILTVNDVADILKVKPITVREMFRTERIRGFKVGKAWRTTEKMLQEDIEMLSRGEAPDKLPKNNGVAKHASKPQKKATDAKASSLKPAKALEKTKGHKPAENGGDAKKAANVDGASKAEEELTAVDTTQQLLF